MHAICPLSMMPMRAEARHASEMVSMLLFGEVFEVLQSTNDWHQVRCRHDGYEGWVTARKLYEVDEAFLGQYDAEPGVYIMEQRAIIEGEHTFMPVHTGGRLPLYGNGAIQLGSQSLSYTGNVFSPSGNIEELLSQFEKLYTGTPYLWGGRSVIGIDCSGLSQMFYRLLGYNLPRDAWQQAEKGETVNSLSEAKAGDLAFFAEKERISHVGILMGDGYIFHASEWVRADKIDEQGIFNKELDKYGLQVKLIKRYL